MKILLLADTLDVGGAETHIYELSRSLLLSGHEIIIHSRGGSTARALERLGVKLLESRAAPLSTGLPQALGELLALLRKHKPDVVHAHTRKSLFLCEIARLTVDFPLVFTAHALFSSDGLKGVFTKPPLFTLAVSEDIKKHLVARFGAAEAQVKVVNNGIDTERFSPPSRLSSHEKPRGVHLLTVSRLDKDCSLCARILCLLAPRLALIYKDFKLTVAGGGNDLERIKSLADDANEKIGHNAVVCIGNCDDVLPHVLDCDLFVGVSRAALEAMSCNKPTILCGNEGYFGICNRENFDTAARENFCARSCPKPTPARLLEDICKILGAEPSPSLALRQKVTEGYRAELMAQVTAEVYERAIEHFRSSQKYDVLLCGYYGFGNFGDELVKSAILASLPSLRVAVAGAVGDGRIWRFDLPSLCRAIKNSGGVILGGGSLLQDVTSRRSLEYYLLVLKIANFYGKRVMLYANGIGPLEGKGAKKACQKALRSVDVASLRDRHSLALAEAMLPPKTRRYLTCDPVLTPRIAGAKTNRIALFVRGEDESPHLTSALARTLPRLCAALGNCEVVFAPMNARRDLSASKRLAASIPTAIYYHPKNTDELVEFISQSRLVISCRLHALIIAASAGVPFIAICSDPKLRAFADECGLPPVLSVSPTQRPAELLERAAEYAVKNEKELSQMLKSRCAKLAPKAKEDAKTALSLFGETSPFR